MRYQICVSGAASGETVRQSRNLAFDLGRAIAEQGGTLTTGATVGLPHYAASGFKSVDGDKGVVVGFSPASSYREHVTVYKLPTKEFDYINYTGMAYVGRDVHLIRSSDALITVGGRMGSLHELATALEGRKVCGVLIGSGGLADYISTLLEKVESPGAKDVIFDDDPFRLVTKVIKALKARYADFEQEASSAVAAENQPKIIPRRREEN